MWTHLPIFLANRGNVAVLKSNVSGKIAQPDGLALLEICSNDRRKSRERAHLANASEFDCQYLTFQISGILYVDCGNQRKSQSLNRADLVISLIVTIGV